MSEHSSSRRVTRLTSTVRRVNRSPRLLDAARKTREWALGEQRIDHGLPTVRGRPVDVAFRQLAALRVDEPGVAGELGAAALQSWQRLAEAQGRGRGEVDVAILFTDLVGFSEWALHAGDELAVRLLREVGEAIEPPILTRGGEVVKRLGDGLMAVFRDARSATEAAFEASERVALVNVDGHRPQLRTGIHLGRPRKVGRDYLGVDVNIAARLAESAQPEEILVSDRTLLALRPGSVDSAPRDFQARGAPADLTAHAVSPCPAHSVPDV
ncbi:MAG TPA: adenylate/guanylate cyclase domain-containing protein [Solirubrobacteraceae bacterium]